MSTTPTTSSAVLQKLQRARELAVQNRAVVAADPTLDPSVAKLLIADLDAQITELNQVITGIQAGAIQPQDVDTTSIKERAKTWLKTYGWLMGLNKLPQPFTGMTVIDIVEALLGL